MKNSRDMSSVKIYSSEFILEWVQRGGTTKESLLRPIASLGKIFRNEYRAQPKEILKNEDIPGTGSYGTLNTMI